MKFILILFKLVAILILTFIGLILFIFLSLEIIEATCKKEQNETIFTTKIFPDGKTFMCEDSFSNSKHFFWGNESSGTTTLEYMAPGSKAREHIGSECDDDFKFTKFYFVNDLIVLYNQYPVTLTVRGSDSQWRTFDAFNILSQKIEETTYFYKVLSSKYCPTYSCREVFNIKQEIETKKLSFSYPTFLFNYEFLLTDDGTDLKLVNVTSISNKELMLRKTKQEDALAIKIPVGWEVGKHRHHDSYKSIDVFNTHVQRNKQHIIRLLKDIKNICPRSFSTIARQDCDQILTQASQHHRSNQFPNVQTIDDIVVHSGQVVRGTVQLKELKKSTQSIQGLLEINNQNFYFCAFSENVDVLIVGKFLEQFVAENALHEDEK